MYVHHLAFGGAPKIIPLCDYTMFQVVYICMILRLDVQGGLFEGILQSSDGSFDRVRH